MNSLTVTAVDNLAKNPEHAVKGHRWACTRLPALFANLSLSRAGNYCPLDYVPSRRGRRRLDVVGVRRTTEARSCRH